MRVFNCESCGHVVFFESMQCVHCGATLAFLPDKLSMGTLVPASSQEASLSDTWVEHRKVSGSNPNAHQTIEEHPGNRYRLCSNRHGISLCNFAIAAEDSNPLCVSCRQTQWLPDASNPANELRWAKIEVAKRQLYYTLAKLGLLGNPNTYTLEPRFALLADMPGEASIMTGHFNGMITINVVEADDDERAKRRMALHEPYRTLIGHLRHESGHFYWDQLIANSEWLTQFRELFGDERLDYGTALYNHYDKDPFDTQWQSNYISAYATSHPWEDWAETWAHYLHMVDLLETSSSYGTRVNVPDLPATPAQTMSDPFAQPAPDFDTMLTQWVPLTLLLNSMNRSLGHVDAYPFSVSMGARRKLRFVHDVILARRQALKQASSAAAG